MPQLSPSGPAHIWCKPWCPKALSGVAEVQAHEPRLVVTLQVWARHCATLPERRGSSAEAMKTRRGQMGVHAGVGSLWDPREQQELRDPTSCCSNARL